VTQGEVYNETCFRAETVNSKPEYTQISADSIEGI
jgi:hypothetical protein